MFVRRFNENLIKQLLEEDLYQQRLAKDVEKGNVFPAIRKNSIGFYYCGGNLFSFNGKFQTHLKYASVLNYDKNYITEPDLHIVKPIATFAEGYDRIKENCSLYSGVETASVANIYSKNSYVCSPKDTVVLDIEISFGSEDEDRNQNRIDMLLYNKIEKRLRFYEAKHFTNKEIWSQVGKKPKVVKQIERYNRQIQKDQDHILQGYKDYVDIVNELFNLNMSTPTAMDSEVVLLIFGFDRDQLQGRFKTLLKDDHSLDGIQHYAIGDESKIELGNVWRRFK